nr:uncharacterized protein LOC108352823 [Rattus norvegicus]
MAGAPAGGTDGLYSEQRECEERVFSLPRSHAAPLTASVRYRQEELREKSPLGRTSFQCGFQGSEVQSSMIKHGIMEHGLQAGMEMKKEKGSYIWIGREQEKSQWAWLEDPKPQNPPAGTHFLLQGHTYYSNKTTPPQSATSRAVSAGEWSLSHEYSGGESYSGYFFYTHCQHTHWATTFHYIFLLSLTLSPHQQRAVILKSTHSGILLLSTFSSVSWLVLGVLIWNYIKEKRQAKLDAQLVRLGNLVVPFPLAGSTEAARCLELLYQQEFVRALAAFLKKSGKLKVPEWVDTVKLAKHKELAPYEENWFYTRAASTARHRVRPSHFSRGSKSAACRVLQALEGLKMVEKDQDGGRKLIPQGQRDLDRIARQVAAANKKH